MARLDSLHVTIAIIYSSTYGVKLTADCAQIPVAMRRTGVRSRCLAPSISLLRSVMGRALFSQPGHCDPFIFRGRMHRTLKRPAENRDRKRGPGLVKQCFRHCAAQGGMRQTPALQGNPG
jgi:hypothetical protein